jgi:hypothetical protein
MATKMNAEELYRRVGRLLENVPDLGRLGDHPQDLMQWFARANALVEAGGDSHAAVIMRSETNDLLSKRAYEASQKALMILYQVFAEAELRAPASAQGAFIPAGNGFDAFAAITKTLSSAKSDILVVDPYMDETILTEFAGAVSSGVALRLLSDKASAKQTFAPAARHWTQQNFGSPLQARLARARALHDRAIFIDHKTAWTLTQSIKDFAKRSPAEIVRADDIAPLKIAAYEDIWLASEVIV